MAGRLANLAKPGELLNKQTRRPKEPMGGKRPRERDEQHLALIRQCDCLCCGYDGRLPGIEAAHVRLANAALGKGKAGISEKPSDRWTVPLCRDCHASQHSCGEQYFWAGVGINPILVASALHAVSPDLEQMRKVIHKFRQEASA